MYYFRIVNGTIANKSKSFDKLQNECDAEMEGFVISESDYRATAIEMMQDSAREINAKGKLSAQGA